MLRDRDVAAVLAPEQVAALIAIEITSVNDFPVGRDVAKAAVPNDLEPVHLPDRDTSVVVAPQYVATRIGRCDFA